MVDNFFEQDLNIDTNKDAEKYAQLIEDNGHKTYFLNGPWGSGKSTFLSNIEHHFKNKKLATLKLWEIEDRRSVMARMVWLMGRTYRQNHPFRTGSMFGMALAAFLVIIFGATLNYKILAVFISILIPLVTLVRSFLETIYAWIVKQFGANVFKNEILVIDDFDRLDVDTQSETYKIFNSLNEDITFIFVGDLSRITRSFSSTNGEGFLTKIIDHRLDLPLPLLPRVFWPDYTSKLGGYIDLNTIQQDGYSSRLTHILFDQFVVDKISLRGRDKFHELLRQEAVLGEKVGAVNLVQLMTVIYLYLFNPRTYYHLKESGYRILEPIGNGVEAHYRQPLFEILEKGRKPHDFMRASNQYFIFGSVSTMKTVDLLAITENVQQLLPYMRQQDSSEVMEYVSSLSDEEFNGVKETFYEAVTKIIDEYGWPNRYAVGILMRVARNWQTLQEYKRKDERVVSTDLIPSEFGDIMEIMDLSQKIRFLIECVGLSGQNVLGLLSSDVGKIEGASENGKADLYLSDQTYPEYIFALFKYKDQNDGFVNEYFDILAHSGPSSVREYIYLTGRIVDSWSDNTHSVMMKEVTENTRLYDYIMKFHGAMDLGLDMETEA
ncbi:P-loop NTPase fold protein [Lactobacillaceae bacterium L1_55_11]|nr:P-loop NTPase fold protein [Lactobacillaceae bacterium L1_55_11]